MTSATVPNFGPDSEAVIAHLKIMQGVISRMARNSAISKTWCVTLVAAIMILVARTGTPAFALIAFLPVVLFMFLDTYYLGLEKAFRRSYDSFVAKLHESELVAYDLYVIKQARLDMADKFSVVKSYSVWPFYSALSGAITLMYTLAVLCG